MKQRFPSRVKKPVAISIRVLEKFEAGSIVGPGVLRTQGWLLRRNETWKLIGNDKLSKKLTVRAHAVSAGARKSIESAGGKIELISE